ncbi:IS256 family transposase [Clostridium septicum]|uniref:Mutator family transposase n=1 Tax=Clostridium septicum TaxID=1504 RepID=A0ABY5B591_CLOSE|nr:IS256 family transposase [Clostridium septicum]USS02529.1 IS256 family transposase [Clostridium septicum]
MSFSKKELIKILAKDPNIKTAEDIQNVLKDLFGGMLQQMLEAELDNHLGYEKHDYQNKNTTNSRNGKSRKTMKSNLGYVDLAVPRDRNAKFETQIIKQYETDVSHLESSIIGMYAKGMTTRDIASQVNEIYGITISPSMVSKITDKVIPMIREWQSRPLETVYPIVYLDAVYFKVRKDNTVVSKAAYAAIGVNIEGKKDVLGIWIGASESSKYWLLVLNELKNRGVKDILIASVDGLVGFNEAIRAVYPNTEIQRCIIHQIRNSSKYLSYKDLKAFNADLKLVYTASTEEVALAELDRLEEKWGDKYGIVIDSWYNNWSNLSTFFKYPPEIRKMIYTTNILEGFNRQIRKFTKTKSIFPNDESLMKILYLATVDITKKWTQSIRGWAQILAQLSIFFEGRLDDQLF